MKELYMGKSLFCLPPLKLFFSTLILYEGLPLVIPSIPALKNPVKIGSLLSHVYYM